MSPNKAVNRGHQQEPHDPPVIGEETAVRSRLNTGETEDQLEKKVVSPERFSGSRGSGKPKVRCVVEKCQGEAKFASARPIHYCRKHEHLLLTDEEMLTEDTIRNLSERIGIRDDGCWQFEQAWGDGIARPSIKSAGLKWRVVRFLRNYFFGGHRGGLELGHTCHQEWCVHPGHVSPISGAKNRKDRDVLNADTDSLGRADRRRLEELRLEAIAIAVSPAAPDDEDSAWMLEKFTGLLGPALPLQEPIAPTPEPEPSVKADEARVDLFLTERSDVSQGRRRRVALAV